MATPATGFVCSHIPRMEVIHGISRNDILGTCRTFLPITSDWIGSSKASIGTVYIKLVLEVLREMLPFPGDDHIRTVNYA